MHCTFCGHIAVSFTSNCSTVRWQKPSTTSAACTRSARIFPKAWFGSERRRLSSRSWSGGQGVPRAPSTARAPCPETPSRYKCKASVLDSSKLLVGVAVPAHSDASHATDARGRRAQPRRDADQPLLGPVAPQPPPGGARIRPARRRCAGRAARMGARGAGPRERTRRPSPPRIREPRPRARVRGRHRAGARVPQPSVLAVRPPPPLPTVAPTRVPTVHIQSLQSSGTVQAAGTPPPPRQTGSLGGSCARLCLVRLRELVRAALPSLCVCACRAPARRVTCGRGA